MSPINAPQEVSAQAQGMRRICIVENARSGDRFAATKINGDSLAGDGIYDGDWVISRLNFNLLELTPGKLVLVDTPAGLKVRHYYLTPDKRVRLLASNNDYLDLVFRVEQVEIKGIVVRIDHVQ